MKKEEAIEVVRKNLPHLGIGATEMTEALETLIPELVESEDERIRRTILGYFQQRNAYRDVDETFDGIPYPDIIAYLEKQKEQKVDIDKLRKDIYQSGYNDGYQHGKVDAQKEQKPEHFELKAGKWYICHRAYCCRADHLTVKEGERFMCEKDGIVKGFVIKEPEKYFKECSAPAPMEDEQKEQKASVEEVLIKAGLKPYKDGNQWCILIGDNIQEGICGFGDTIDDALYHLLREAMAYQKEQKPAERATMQDFNYHDGEPDKKAWGRLIAILNYAEATSGDTPGEEVQALINWIEGKQKEQKPLPGFDDLTPEEKMNHPLYLEGFDTGREVGRVEAEQKPAEWSEEEKRAIDRACVALRAYSNGDLPEFLPSELLGYADRLQSLRPQPHWKPSEEQMNFLFWLERELLADNHTVAAETLAGIYEDLEKL